MHLSIGNEAVLFLQSSQGVSRPEQRIRATMNYLTALPEVYEGGLPAITTLFEDMSNNEFSQTMVDAGFELPELFAGCPCPMEMWPSAKKEDDDMVDRRSASVEEQGKIRVQEFSRELGISQDPVNWSREDVLKWLRRTTRFFNLCPAIEEHKWVVDGAGLCQMKHEDFCRILSRDGDVIMAELNVWKSAQLAAGCSSNGMPFDIYDGSQDHLMNSPDVSYANLDPVDSFQPPGNSMMSCHQLPLHDMQQQFIAPHQLLQADPNLQATTNCVDGVLPWESREILGVVKSEQPDENQLIEDHIWQMQCNITNYSMHAPKPKQPSQRWPVAGHHNLDGMTNGNGPRMMEVMSPHPRRGKRTICLWQFLKELLLQPDQHSQSIRWLDRMKGIFKIEDSVRVARLWGERKNRPAMNYDKLSRSIRQYYKKGIIKKTANSKRLVYQFCSQYM